MARPLQFELTIESDDPAGDRERLLSARPSEAALKTLREVDQLDLSRLQLDPPGRPRRPDQRETVR